MAESFTLHSFVGCPFSLTCIVAAKALNLPVKNQVYTKKEQVTSAEYVSLTQGQVPALETSEGVLTTTEAIVRYLSAQKSHLNLSGESVFEKAKVDMWLAMMREEQLICMSGKLRFAQTGLSKWTQEGLDFAKTRLRASMVKFEEHLALRTYFVGNSVTLADLHFACILAANRSTLLDSDFLKGFANVQRHFNDITSKTFWTQVMGRTFSAPAKQFPLPDPTTVTQASNTHHQSCPVAGQKGNQQQPQGKCPMAGKGQQNQTPKKGKGKQQKQTPKKVEKVEEKVEEKVVKKELTAEELAEQEAAKKAGAWFYDFKTLFANATDKAAVAQTLFKEMDATRFSVWHVLYDKLPQECHEVIKTSNQLSFFMRGLEGINRDALIVHGIYGTEPTLDLKGLWMWRGAEVHPIVKELPSYEYYAWNKLDLTKKADQDRVLAYWTGLVQDESVVEGQVNRVVKVFK